MGKRAEELDIDNLLDEIPHLRHRGVLDRPDGAGFCIADELPTSILHGDGGGCIWSEGVPSSLAEHSLPLEETLLLQNLRNRYPGVVNLFGNPSFGTRELKIGQVSRPNTPFQGNDSGNFSQSGNGSYPISDMLFHSQMIRGEPFLVSGDHLVTMARKISKGDSIPRQLEGFIPQGTKGLFREPLQSLDEGKDQVDTIFNGIIEHVVDLMVDPSASLNIASCSIPAFEFNHVEGKCICLHFTASHQHIYLYIYIDLNFLAASFYQKTDVRQSRSPSAIIIGGGFAGIAAAHALKNAAFQVVLLESRDRIGGRVHTNYSFGFPVDMGAAWLHGVCNENPLASWIGRLGLPIYRTSGDNSVLYDHDLESYALFDGDGHQVPQDLVEKVGKVEFEGLGELRSKDEEDEGLGELRSKDEEDEGI
ncbi:hypothetical protein ZIOFF_009757 [Zingiber officinale]|uniref:Amine oxidase domain-containing protein n=1 Tax=Zingiber officinale TaxID=94328 RepID=A0A8J5HYE8_ZINOF|nr:hypothetical protein ZIOFF_009757 [Zingiber officinale]